MKLKKELYLRKICDEYILVPTGKTVDMFNGLFYLTESGARIFEAIEQGKEKPQIIKALLEEFDVDEKTAEDDYSTFIAQLEKFDII